MRDLKNRIAENKKTYISLFSSAGVGCYGFKQAGFECIATNELIERRLEIQKFNNKCKYDSGYICGDITTTEIKNELFDQVELWKQKEYKQAHTKLIDTSEYLESPHYLESYYILTKKITTIDFRLYYEKTENIICRFGDYLCNNYINGYRYVYKSQF